MKELTKVKVLTLIKVKNQKNVLFVTTGILVMDLSINHMFVIHAMTLVWLNKIR